MNQYPSVKLISSNLIEEVAAKAADSVRLRSNFNFHRTATDNPHRFLNILLRDTYVRPHRHISPPKDETFLVLDGVAAIVLFDDSGGITHWHKLGSDSDEGHVWGVDIAAGIWHTLFPITARAVCFEVKPGPWDPGTDKDFAAWAPAEDDPSKGLYLKELQQRLAIG